MPGEAVAGESSLRALPRITEDPAILHVERKGDPRLLPPQKDRVEARHCSASASAQHVKKVGRPHVAVGVARWKATG
nr:hypothetical protein Iba_chr07cCG6730 [Ipomoea batatas]